ncbi:WD repeat-containing protein 24 [Geranomyces variabilis]|uniref:WD repeat-containing protein 24 n=1 Tax=Geranomyces variabilis TaxID=109894 RepID=A0AAD5TDP4_9FUNG|nr:WD repeat-containing protein 24 [Geranomyces variabilis]
MKKSVALASIANGGSNGSLGHSGSLSPAMGQSTALPSLRLRVTGQLSAIAASADMDWAVVAGREVLKIVAVYATDVKEVLNLRAGAKVSTNFAIQDVKWGNSFAKSTVATAASNGAVIIWDLNRPNVHKLERILTEHTRAVNRISFHPTEPVLLLSASQDGSMRLWDLRAKSIARNAFEGRAESVRDVQFSPTNPYEFVAGFENGNIQKWDIRFPNQHERKWNGHNGLALTIDWHPDGRLVASGGRDRLVKVWDMKSESRLPLYTIQTIAPVARVSWRPGHDGQLASCSLATDYSIHLWDLSRPYIASKTLEAHDSVTTGFLWRDANTLWSCSKDRSFARHDMRLHAFRPMDYLNTSAVAWNVDGELTFAIDERNTLPTAPDGSGAQAGASISLGPAIMSTADDTGGLTEEQRAGLPPAIPNQSLVQGGAAAVAAAASSYYPLRRAVKRLPERVVGEEKIVQYRPRQRTGIADSETFDVHAFIAFATELQIDPNDVWTSCDNNAQLAMELGLLRTAQTWKILQLLYGGRAADTLEPRNLSALFASAPHRSSESTHRSQFADGGRPSSGRASLSTNVTSPAVSTLEALFAPLDKSSDTHTDDVEKLGVTSSGRSVHSDVIPETEALHYESHTMTVGSTHSDSAILKDSFTKAPSKITKSDSWVSTYATIHRSDAALSTAGFAGSNSLQGNDGLLDLDNNNDIERAVTANVRSMLRGDRRLHYRHGHAAHSNSDDGGVIDEEDEEEYDSDSPPVSSSDSESSFTYGLKVGAGRRTLARFGIGTRAPPMVGVSGAVSDGSPAPLSSRPLGRSFTRTRRRSQFGGSNGPTPSNNHSAESIHSGAAATAAIVPPLHHPHHDVVLPRWNHDPVVHDALSYYGEQGNVQMCVTILLVLGNRIRVDEKMQELWFWSYIDLLHRFKLWIPATAVIRAAPVPSVRARNQESTTIHTICNQCSKPMIPATNGAPNWACEHCGRLVNPCSFCHKTTKGLYAWCQGCTHGGHLECLTDWFSDDLECCTGCGHQCLSRPFTTGIDVGG